MSPWVLCTDPGVCVFEMLSLKSFHLSFQNWDTVWIPAFGSPLLVPVKEVLGRSSWPIVALLHHPTHCWCFCAPCLCVSYYDDLTRSYSSYWDALVLFSTIENLYCQVFWILVLTYVCEICVFVPPLAYTNSMVAHCIHSLLCICWSKFLVTSCSACVDKLVGDI